MAASETLLITLKAKDEASAVAQKLTRDFGGFQKTVMAAGLAAAAATTAAVVGVTKIVADGVGKAMELEQSVADIASVMGMTADQAQPLSDLITNLGLDPKLKVDATEAADAIQMLAQNGLNMTDVVDGAARATVLLANATGGDFSIAADTATDAMAIFGINAKNMADAVDGIVGVTTSSKFAIGDYQLALSQAGGVASALGVSFDDFNATIAAISPSFASGSDAGTSFKTFLMRLIPQSNEATEAMRALGLFSGLTSEEFAKVEENIAKTEASIAALDPTSKTYAEDLADLTGKLDVMRGSLVQGQNAFYTADGSMRSMSEIAGILQGATKNLSEEQKNQMLSTIFGTDAMRAAFGIAEAGTATLDAMKKKIGDTSAEDSAATRMDTLAGVWEIFQGQVDALSTGIGQKFLPTVRNMVDWFVALTDVYGPSVVTFFGDIADGVVAFMGKWSEYWPKLSKVVFDEKTGILASFQEIKDSITEIGSFLSGSDVDFTWTDFFVKMAQSVTLTVKAMVQSIADLTSAVSLAFQAFEALKSGDWERAAQLSGELAGKLGDALYQNSIFGAIGRGQQINDMWEGRAAGGPVMAGNPYWVGEMGPELFVPKQSGTIVPNATTNNYNFGGIHLAGSGDDGRDVFGTVELLGALYG